MKHIIFILLLFMLSFTLLAETLKLVTLEYPPYQYLKDDKVEGMVPTILEKTFYKLGYKIEISVNPWEESLEMIKNKEADAIFTIFRTPEREEFLDYSDVVLILQQTAFFTLKDSEIKFVGKIEEVKELTIGVVNSVSYGDAFDKAVIDLELDRKVFETTESCIEALAKGEIDLLVNNVDGANYLLNEMKLYGQIVQNGPAIEKIPSYLAFAKKDELKDIKSEFDKMLSKILDK